MNHDDATIPQHNHQRKLRELARQGRLSTAPGVVSGISVYHDDWCALINGRGVCNCDPEIQTTWLLPAGLDN